MIDQSNYYISFTAVYTDVISKRSYMQITIYRSYVHVEYIISRIKNTFETNQRVNWMDEHGVKSAAYCIASLALLLAVKGETLARV